MGVNQWSGEAWAAVVTAGVLAVSALAAGFRWLLSDRNAKAYERGWERVAELDEEVRLLRIALHRATQRGNVALTVSEVLLLAMPLPLRDRINAVHQARLIAERSLSEGAK